MLIDQSLGDRLTGIRGLTLHDSLNGCSNTGDATPQSVVRMLAKSFPQLTGPIERILDQLRILVPTRDLKSLRDSLKSDRSVEPMVQGEAKQSISFEFGGRGLLDKTQLGPLGTKVLRG